MPPGANYVSREGMEEEGGSEGGEEDDEYGDIINFGYFMWR